ncbi:serine hydrolase [Streptomyces sp. NPDC090077]|uniref:D-alanyl-D-alanine carboxypeptidase family protein n=1 Tax=Streptomyces sp. NPDC090077 TaxID=3365938 RepID=UPI00382B7B8D
MKAETVADGTRGGRGPVEDGARVPAGDEPGGRAPAGSEPGSPDTESAEALAEHGTSAPAAGPAEREADATDAPAGRKTGTSGAGPTDAPAGHGAGTPGAGPADRPAGRGADATDPAPDDTGTGRETSTPRPKSADAPAGHGAGTSGAGRGASAPEGEPTDARAGRDAGTSGAESAHAPAGSKAGAPDAESTADTEPAGRGAGASRAESADAPAGNKAGTSAGGPADAPARRGADGPEARAGQEAAVTGAGSGTDARAAPGPAGRAPGSGDAPAAPEDGIPADGTGPGSADVGTRPDGGAPSDPRLGREVATPRPQDGVPGARGPQAAASARPEGGRPSGGKAVVGGGSRPEPEDGGAREGKAEVRADGGADDDEPARETSAPGPKGRGPAREKAAGSEPEDTGSAAVEPVAGRPEGGGDRPSWARPGRAPERPRPSWAKGEQTPEPRAAAQPHDPERTSEFVALKDPDAPTPPKPAPAPPQRPAPAVLEPTREAPLPPLELLAELTNTAPPPETVRRTLTRRVKVWTPIVLLLGGAVVGAQLLRPLPAPAFVTTQASHTIEGSTAIPWPAKGQAAVRLPGSGDIRTFGEQKPVPTASVGKVMTAYVILKNHPLRKNEPGPAIEIDAKAVAEGKSEDESRIKDLTLGQKFSEQDMLKMMMIPSANNIARQLARWDSGNDEAAFVAKMNAAAKELGMRDTAYTDPSGLDAGTVSTAVDQLKLAEAVMREEAFRDIVEMASSPIKGRTEGVGNNNTLLQVRGLEAVGIKTGSSTPAGGTLMWAAEKKVGGESPLILGAMMEQRVDGPDPNAAKSLELVLNNSRKIIEAVRKALAPATVIRKGQLVGHVSDGLGGSTPLVATKDLTVIGVPGQQLRLSLGAGAKPLPHEAKAGTEVGLLTVGDGEGAKSVPVAVGTDLVEPSFGARVIRLS